MFPKTYCTSLFFFFFLIYLQQGVEPGAGVGRAQIHHVFGIALLP